MQQVKLNLARNCIKYLIKTYGITELFIPYYTCETVWKAIKEEHCTIHFYHIDKNFEPLYEFPKDAYIIYTNYFGLCTEICEKLSEKYPKMIIDNSQAFFSSHVGFASFNSLRKFFNVTNGAYLYTNKTLDEHIEQDSLDLPSANFQQNFEQFVQNELTLNEEKSIKTLSKKVEKLMENIDFSSEKVRRLEIFNKYKEILEKENLIKLLPNKNEIPYCYPFCTKNENIKKILLENNIILLRLWKDFPKNFDEEWLNNTVALPLDNPKYADKIISLIKPFC